MITVRRAATGLAVTGLFAASMWIQTHEVPLEQGTTAPLGPTGEIGKVVSNRFFSVKVEKYDVARSIRGTGSFGSSAQTLRTDGLFLVLYAQIRSDREPLTPSTPKLVTSDGLNYLESSRVKSLGDLRTYQPQLWYKTAISFELPKDKLEGAHLVIDNTKIINLLPAKVEVDLGIDAAAAARLRARPQESYQVKEPDG